MSDFQTIADRVEIEALRGEFTERIEEHKDRHVLTPPVMLQDSPPDPFVSPAGTRRLKQGKWG